MIQLRTIHGLAWRPYGPSHWELAAAPQVTVTFLGDGWFLFDCDRLLRRQPFASRDAACKLVAESFAVDNAAPVL